jgi:hypothetical protein
MAVLVTVLWWKGTVDWATASVRKFDSSAPHPARPLRKRKGECVVALEGAPALVEAGAGSLEGVSGR